MKKFKHFGNFFFTLRKNILKKNHFREKIIKSFFFIALFFLAIKKMQIRKNKSQNILRRLITLKTNYQMMFNFIINPNDLLLLLTFLEMY